VIAVACPKCGRHLAVPASLAGQSETCPDCGAHVPVPAPPAAEDAAGSRSVAPAARDLRIRQRLTPIERVRAAHPALARALEDLGRDVEVGEDLARRNAASAFFTRAGPDVIPPLLGVLHDETLPPPLRRRVLSALVLLGPNARPALDDVAALADDRRAPTLLRAAALRALWELHQRVSLCTLLEVVRDTRDPGVQREAEQLGRLVRAERGRLLAAAGCYALCLAVVLASGVLRVLDVSAMICGGGLAAGVIGSLLSWKGLTATLPESRPPGKTLDAWELTPRAQG